MLPVALCMCVWGATVKELLDSRADLSVMRGMVGAVRSVEWLNNPPLLSFFPPQDAAFASLPYGSMDLLTTEPSYSEALVRLHIVTGVSITHSGILSTYGNRGVGMYSSDLGSRLDISVVSNTMKIKTETELDIASVATELSADNGVLQILDQVLYTVDVTKSIPTKVLTDEGVMPSIFREAFLASGVQLPTDRSVTILAPSNEAFNRMQITSGTTFSLWPRQVLRRFIQYLMLDGYYGDTTLRNRDQQAVNTFDQNNRLSISIEGNTAYLKTATSESATVIANETAKNGLVQVTDTVLTAPGVVLPTKSLVSAGVLPDLFRAAVRVALMSDILTSGNLTVFAPSDDAFNFIGVKAEEDLFKFSFSDLQRLIKHHMVRGAFTVDVLQQATPFSLTTLTLNTVLSVDARDKMSVSFDGTTAFVQSNVTCTDGLGYVTDKVLFPPGVGPISTAEQEGANLTLIDVVLVGALSVCVLIGGAYVLYKGSIGMYLRTRRAELKEQEKILQQEAMRDDTLKKSLHRDHNGFRALGEVPDEEDIPSVELNQVNLGSVDGEALKQVGQDVLEQGTSTTTEGLHKDLAASTPSLHPGPGPDLLNYTFPVGDGDSVVSIPAGPVKMADGLQRSFTGTSMPMHSLGRGPPIHSLGRGRRFSHNSHNLPSRVQPPPGHRQQGTTDFW